MPFLQGVRDLRELLHKETMEVTSLFALWHAITGVDSLTHWARILLVCPGIRFFYSAPLSRPDPPTCDVSDNSGVPARSCLCMTLEGSVTQLIFGSSVPSSLGVVGTVLAGSAFRLTESFLSRSFCSLTCCSSCWSCFSMKRNSVNSLEKSFFNYFLLSSIY